MAAGIKKLYLQNFRNHSALQMDIDSSIVVIAGKNGKGKTNILEAVSLLAPGKGLRKASLKDLQNYSAQNFNKVQNSGGGWAVFAELENKNEEEITIGTALSFTKESGKEKRIIKIDGENCNNQNELSKNVSMLWLVPQMDLILSESATERRLFLDRLCGFFFANYSNYIGAYDNLRRQRIKVLTGYRPDHSWVEVIERQMAEKCIAIADLRIKTIELLNDNMSFFNDSDFLKCTLKLDGEAENALANFKATQAENIVFEKFVENRQTDARFGKTSIGAHKTNLEVINNTKNISASFCSTGEQKSMMLSIIISAIMSKKGFNAQVPILLLDEVISHLDEGRRNMLFKTLIDTKIQAWLTGTDLETFSTLSGKAQFFEI